MTIATEFAAAHNAAAFDFETYGDTLRALYMQFGFPKTGYEGRTTTHVFADLSVAVTEPAADGALVARED